MANLLTITKKPHGFYDFVVNENLTDIAGSAAEAFSPSNQETALGRPHRTGNTNEKFGDWLEALTIIFNAPNVFKTADGVNKEYLIKLVRQGAKSKTPNNLQIPISGGVQLFTQGGKLKLQAKPSDVFLAIEETPAASTSRFSPAGSVPKPMANADDWDTALGTTSNQTANPWSDDI